MQGSGNVAHFGSDPGGTVILRYNAAGAVDGSDRGVAAFPGRFSCSAFESGFQVKSLSLNKYKRRVIHFGSDFLRGFHGTAEACVKTVPAKQATNRYNNAVFSIFFIAFPP